MEYEMEVYYVIVQQKCSLRSNDDNKVKQLSLKKRMNSCSTAPIQTHLVAFAVSDKLQLRLDSIQDNRNVLVSGRVCIVESKVKDD